MKLLRSNPPVFQRFNTSMLKSRLAGWLFRLARWKPIGMLVPWGFAHMSDLLPLKRVFEGEYVIAFEYPRPLWQHHILIVPRQAVATFQLLDTNSPVAREILTTAQHLVVQFGLEKSGYRLIVNGGAYQDVPQMHFHLVAGASRSEQTE